MGKIIDRGPVLAQLGLGSSITDNEKKVVNQAIISAEGVVKRFLGYDPAQRERTEYYPRFDTSRNARQIIWEANDAQAYQRHLTEAATDELQLQHLPIRSSPTVQVWIDYDGRSGRRSGSFAAETAKVEGEDFWANFDLEDDAGNVVCSDGILRSIGLWPTTAGSVKVTYTAGYTATELNGGGIFVDATPIYEACVMEAVKRAKRAFVDLQKQSRGHLAGKITSETLGSYSYSVQPGAIDKLLGSYNSKASAEAMDLMNDFVNVGLLLGG